MAQTAVFEHLAALADQTRCRMLLLLEGRELTVSELCVVLQLPQSTVSRHLKTLADVGWVSSRRDGTSRYYAVSLDDRSAGNRRLWLTVRDQIALTPGAEQDAHRLKGALASRRSKSQEFFSSVAAHWDRVREELYGLHFSVRGMFGFFDPDWVVGDLGCGTGQVAAGLAPFVRRVIAVDGSGEMLAAARRRLQEFDNVVIRRGDLETLPIEEGELDAAALVLVLHYLPQPGQVLREAARVLKPGGRLVVIDMLPHDREEYRQQMGHVWLGFDETRIGRDLESAGFERCRVRALPAERDVKGPALFVAMGLRAQTPALVGAGGTPGAAATTTG